jgi:hypothetical protein
MACIDLPSKGAQKRARSGEPPAGAVKPHRFQELHEEGRKLIQSRAERAAAQIDCAECDTFEPFME